MDTSGEAGSSARRLALTLCCAALAAAAYDGRNSLSYPNRELIERHNIPKKFEIKGGDPVREFSKYAADMESLARTRNLAVKYDINVTLQKKKAQQTKRKHRRHLASKKYLVPLKRVKASSLDRGRPEVEEETARAPARPEPPPTPPPPAPAPPPRPHRADKYRPVYNRVRSPARRRVRPVKSDTVNLNLRRKFNAA